MDPKLALDASQEFSNPLPKPPSLDRISQSSEGRASAESIAVAIPPASEAVDDSDVALLHGWRKPRDHPSLEEVHNSISVPGEDGRW